MDSTSGVSSAIAALSSPSVLSSIAVSVLSSTEQLESAQAVQLVNSLGVGNTVNTTA